MTKKEKRFLDTWSSLQEKLERSPSYPEMMDAMGFNYPNSVTQYYKQLASKGYFKKAADAGWSLVTDHGVLCPTCGNHTTLNVINKVV